MTETSAKPICGIVMPISALDGCAEAHWSDVLTILSDAIEEAGFDPNIVSNADDVGIIQKRIIQNLYDNPIVVCDVSGKNPNVMFELEMRLAFDKPTIIVKDDVTSYSFDTSPIEHLEYPRDLRFSRIVDFKDKLVEKLKNTHAKASSDPSYTTFLKHFGEFTVAKINKKEVTGEQFIIEELRALRRAVGSLDRGRITRDAEVPILERGEMVDVCLGGRSDEEVQSALVVAENFPGAVRVSLEEVGKGHRHIYVRMPSSSLAQRSKLKQMIRAAAGLKGQSGTHENNPSGPGPTH
jgi:hypothetical protein